MVSYIFLQIVVFSIFATRNTCSGLQERSYNYTITKTWNGDDTSDPVNIFVSYAIQPDPDGVPSLRILIDAPYYNDPKIPADPPSNQPRQGLWELEVVEPYFLGENNEYLEIELAPSGHYILFYLSGYRKDTNRTEQMPLKHYHAQIYENQGRWTGEAFIPGSYFPCGVNKFNLFAIHKSGESRRYMALYPVKDGEIGKPDFHYLSVFKPTPFAEGVEINPNCGKGMKPRKNQASSPSDLGNVVFLLSTGLLAIISSG